MPTEYLTGDYHGADITLSNGDVIGGVLTGIGRFTIPAGATGYVKGYTGTGSPYGVVEIHALHVYIYGVLDATGSGGGGGGGGGGYQHAKNGTGYGGGGNGIDFEDTPAGHGGWGGEGGGSFYGAGGQSQYEDFGLKGLPGGYMTAGGQGDSSIGEEVYIGSGGGGGGGGGGVGSFPTGGGGGGGGNSGGCIKIYSSTIHAGINGAILSNNMFTGDGGRGGGTAGGGGGGGGAYPSAGGVSGGGGGTNGTNTGTSNGGNGAQFSDISRGWGGPHDQNGVGGPSGGSYGKGGGGGGSGSGGGILIRASRYLPQITVMPKVYLSGTINNVGGLGVTNGGTAKIRTYGSHSSIVAPITGRDYRLPAIPFGALAG